jgi:hypothetical protein
MRRRVVPRPRHALGNATNGERRGRTAANLLRFAACCAASAPATVSSRSDRHDVAAAAMALTVAVATRPFVGIGHARAAHVFRITATASAIANSAATTTTQQHNSQASHGHILAPPQWTQQVSARPSHRVAAALQAATPFHTALLAVRRQRLQQRYSAETTRGDSVFVAFQLTATWHPHRRSGGSSWLLL